MGRPDQRPNTNQPTTSSTERVDRIDHIDRRAVIRGAGVVGASVVGAAALAACGGGGESSSAAGAVVSGKDMIKKSQIPVGGGKVLAAQKVVVTQPKAGEFKAFSAVCTHQGCTVAQVADGTIDCPCHGSKFDIATGQVKDGPARAPLPAKGVKVTGGSITISG